MKVLCVQAHELMVPHKVHPTFFAYWGTLLNGILRHLDISSPG